LDNIYNKGLSDSPPDRRLMVGTSSFAWASISNGLGFNFPGVSWLDFGQNLNTSNIWSWQNARGYEWLGLTATSRSERQENLLYMSRAIGQVMHLLEDTTQPQHVRNEQHLDQIYGFNTTWRSPIEDYGNENVNNLNYEQGILDWKGAGFTKLEDFWDRHLYNGNAAALDADVNGGTSTLGLAEWCNGNFLGLRHSYAEYSSAGDIRHYPFPSLFTSTGYLQHGAYVDMVTLKNGKQANRIYLHKTTDGIQVSHFSVASYLGTRFPNKIFPTHSSIDDDNVLNDYHQILIPKAVEFSAGLLDYFCRGQLVVSLGLDTNTDWYTITNSNVSGQPLYNGTFSLYQDLSGTRTLLQQTNFVGVLTNGGSITMAYTNPVPPGASFYMIYQGAIGMTSGSASDPVDAGIAIAVKEFGIGPYASEAFTWTPCTGQGDGEGGWLYNVYSIPAGIVYSTISVEDADEQAFQWAKEMYPDGPCS
jgi:hypothetical protein